MKNIEEESTTSKGMKMLSAGNRSGGTSSSNKKKGKAQAHAPTTTEITPQNIAFEELSEMECKKWWQENPNSHAVKASIRRAQVEWAIRMLVFCI